MNLLVMTDGKNGEIAKITTYKSRINISTVIIKNGKFPMDYWCRRAQFNTQYNLNDLPAATDPDETILIYIN